VQPEGILSPEEQVMLAEITSLLESIYLNVMDEIKNYIAIRLRAN